MVELSDKQRALVDRLVSSIAQLDGVEAVALGGSFARGAAKPDSDIDLGIYYRDARRFSIEQLRAIANQFNDTPDPVLTDFGGWGPWVIGGAWLTIGGQRVDFLYRSLDRLQQIIDESRAGRFQTDYEQQPATGFYSYIYLAELSICVPLYDPAHLLSALKAQVSEYPPALKAAIIREYIWRVSFTLENTEKAAKRGDIYVTVACLIRAFSGIVQIVFAQNERYFISDKGALEECDQFDRKPDRFKARVEVVLSNPGDTPAQLMNSVKLTRALFEEALK